MTVRTAARIPVIDVWPIPRGRGSQIGGSALCWADAHGSGWAPGTGPPRSGSGRDARSMRRANWQFASFFLVFFENGQRSCMQLWIFAAGIQRSHSTDGQRTALAANLGDQAAQGLEERHVVRDRIAVGQHERGVVQVEMTQACQVIPAAEVQPDDMVTQVVEELLHLICQRM